MTNHFNEVVTEVKQSPKNQKFDTLIQGIAQQMQGSGNAEIIQYGQELQQVKAQLVSALQQS